MFKWLINFFKSRRIFKKYHLTVTLDAHFYVMSIEVFNDNSDDIYHKIIELRGLSNYWRLGTERSNVLSDYSYKIDFEATFDIEAKTELEARNVINHVLKQIKAKVRIFGHWRQKIYILKEDQDEKESNSKKTKRNSK